MKTYIVYFIRVFFYYFFRIFHIDNNKIFFQNFNGKGYGDNPKYIAEEIIRQGLNFRLIWAVSKNIKKVFPPLIITVPYKSLRSIYEEVTSKFWIDNCRKQLYVRKRKKQFYIQTWHGVIGLKKTEKDVEEQLSAYYVKQAKNDSLMINLFLSDSNYFTHLYKTVFWYDGEIFECGSPRDDILFNPSIDINSKVRNFFNIPENTKIILYAPTFRDDFNEDSFNINSDFLINSLSKKTNEPWILLMRLHPNITDNSKFFEFTNKTINASYYDDIQELLIASDIMITDYSSCMYEFALMNKPVFLYINDYDKYKNERDFYFDLLTLPFPHVNNVSELPNVILNFNLEKYLESVKLFFNKVGVVNEGIACKKVINRIKEENKYEGL